MRFRLCIALILMSAVLTQVNVVGQSGTQSKPEAFGTSEYRLGPGDMIEVFVWKESEPSTQVVIRPDGNISLPLIGELVANGKTARQLQEEVTGKLSRWFEAPVVNVIVKEVHSARVSVLGEVKNPGVYPIGARATILDAVALAGGFTEYAKRDKVTLIRNSPTGDPERYRVNLEEQIKNAKTEIVYVFPYDTIYVQ